MTVDLLNKRCSSCKFGKYIETSIQDDIDGSLHCSKCNVRIKRYKSIKKLEEKLDRRARPIC